MADGLNGGTLLGVNDLQRTIDANTKAVAELSSAVASMRRNTGGGFGAATMAGGTPNGGGATFGGVPSMGSPSGPVMPSGTSMGAMGKAAWGNIKWGFNAGMSDEDMFNARVTFDTIRKINGGYQGSKTNEKWLRASGGNSVTGFNAMDTAGSMMMVANQWGHGQKAVDMNRMVGAVGVLDPTMSRTQQAQVMSGFGTVPMNNQLRMFGINTYANGSQRSVSQIAQDVLRRTGLLGKKLNEKQIQASIVAPNSFFQANLAMFGVTGAMASSVTKAAANMVRANSAHGMSYEKFDQLTQAAQGNDSAGKAARKELKAAGVTELGSALQTQKTHASNEAEAATEGLDAFSKSLEITTETLNLFQDAIRSIPLIGDLVGANQGSGGLLGKGLSMLGGGGAGRLMSLGGVGLSMGTKVLGGLIPGGGLDIAGGESGPSTGGTGMPGAEGTSSGFSGLSLGFSGSFYGGYSEAAALSSGFATGASGGPGSVSASTGTASSGYGGFGGGSGGGSGGGGGKGNYGGYGNGYSNTGFGGVKPWVARAGHEMKTLFNIGTVGGVGSRSNKSDHPSGHALDFMCTGSTGDNLSAYAKQHAKRMGITYIIWQQRIWNISRAREGWRKMEDRGSITANHFDHVHVSFQYSDPDPELTRQNNSQGYGGGGKGGGGKGGGGGTPAQNKALGKQMAASRGWSGQQWDALEALWTQESGWRHTADNPTSSAYGIPQALIALHKMPNGYYDRKTGSGGSTQGHGGSPRVQIEWGLNYIAGRYGNPKKAWDFHKRNNWYDKGAWEIKQDEDARLHKGEMVIPKPAAEQIRDVLQKTAAMSGKSGGGGGITLDFKPGAVVIHLGSGATPQVGKAIASEFAKALASDTRIKALQAGNH